MAQAFYPYNPKQVVVYAADVFMYINGIDELFVCQSTTEKTKISDSLMTVSTDLKTDTSPGSATFSIAVPRHSFKKFFRSGRCAIEEMMEVTIFMKGRYLDQNQRPVYYQTFWGVVTDVNVNYGSGQNTINVTCQDILYFWAITRIATNPAVFQQTFDGTLDLTTFTNIFNHLSPYQIIIALARVLMGNLLTPQNHPRFGVGQAQIAKGTFMEERDRITSYWRKRQQAIGGRLRIFGAAMGKGDESIKNMTAPMSEEMMNALTGDAVARNRAVSKAAEANGQAFPVRPDIYKDPRSLMKMAETSAGSEAFSLDTSLYSQYYPYNASSQVSDFSTGEDMSRLEIANQVKDFIGYEFFMDVTGEVIFKPPFYNVDVRENDPVSIIRDLDILSMDLNTSAQEILTQLDVRGAYSTYQDGGDVSSIPYGSYRDYRLTEKFGIKSESVVRSFLPNSALCTLYAIAELSKFNARHRTATISIIGRPELRLGYPVYIESLDTFYYVKGIAHNYTANGRLETSLTLEGARSKYLPFDVSVKEGRSLVYDDPLRPRLKGVANVVLTMDVPKQYADIIQPIGPGDKTMKVQAEVPVTASTIAKAVQDKIGKGIQGLTGTVSKIMSPTQVNTSKKDATTVPKNLPSSVASSTAKTSAQVGADAKAVNKKVNDTFAASPGGTPPGAGSTDASKKALAKVQAQAAEATKQATTVPNPGALASQNAQQPRGATSRDVLPNGAALQKNMAEHLMRVSEGAVGIEFQTFGRPREIVQPGVYVANKKQIPVSDEFGYELIGGFGYGRGVKLDYEGVLRTYLPASKQVPGAQVPGAKEAKTSAQKKEGKPVDEANTVSRITGDPDLKQPKNGRSYDDLEQDYVSRFAGKTIGAYKQQDVGKYLSEMGSKLDNAYQVDDMNCQLTATEAATIDASAEATNAALKKRPDSDFAQARKNADIGKLGGDSQPGVPRNTGGPASVAASTGGIPGGARAFGNSLNYNKELTKKIASAREAPFANPHHSCYHYAWEAIKKVPSLAKNVGGPGATQDENSNAVYFNRFARRRPDLVQEYHPRTTADLIPGTIIVFDTMGGERPPGHIEVWGDDGRARSDFTTSKGHLGYRGYENLWKAGRIKFYLPK